MLWHRTRESRWERTTPGQPQHHSWVPLCRGRSSRRLWGLSSTQCGLVPGPPAISLNFSLEEWVSPGKPVPWERAAEGESGLTPPGSGPLLLESQHGSCSMPLPSPPLCLVVLHVGLSLSCTAHLATGLGWYRFTSKTGVSYDVNLFRVHRGLWKKWEGTGEQGHCAGAFDGQAFIWTSRLRGLGKTQCLPLMRTSYCPTPYSVPPSIPGLVPPLPTLREPLA